MTNSKKLPAKNSNIVEVIQGKIDRDRKNLKKKLTQ